MGAGPPQESQVIGQAKVDPNTWPNYITKGFNLHLLRESTPAQAFAAGKMMTVPVMVRLEYDASRNAVRIGVRTSDGETTRSLSKIIETYLVVPSQQNGSS